jgi:hypothetical protein
VGSGRYESDSRCVAKVLEGELVSTSQYHLDYSQII